MLRRMLITSCLVKPLSMSNNDAYSEVGNFVYSLRSDFNAHVSSFASTIVILISYLFEMGSSWMRAFVQSIFLKS